MYAKIFSQIFDSSIAGEFQTRHVFMDLLVLADSEGVVDMTLDAISRRTNVPPEIVEAAIKKLSSPDHESRSNKENGARLQLIDSHRDWGWQVVNYEHYRKIRDEEARREYFRDAKRRQRKALSKTVKDSQRMSNGVQLGPSMSTYAEAEAEEERGEGNGAPRRPHFSEKSVKPISGQEGIRREKELSRVEAAISVLRGRHGGEKWPEAAKAEVTRLKARRQELLTLLGMAV